jgi:hypothetical protein
METLKIIGASIALTVMPLIEAPTRASELTQLQLADLVQSTANDIDAALLTVLSASNGPVSFLYDSTAADSTWSSWTGAFNGNTGGTPFSLTYNGALSGFPPGTETWSAVGTLGGASVTGGGSATLSDPPGSFELSFSDSLTVGGVTASVNFTAPGTILSNGFMLGSPGNPEVDGGPIGDPKYVEVSYLWVRPGFDFDDAFLIYPHHKVLWLTYSFDLLPPIHFRNMTIPEPSTWILVLLGFAGLGCVGANARRRVGGMR